MYIHIYSILTVSKYILAILEDPIYYRFLQEAFRDHLFLTGHLKSFVLCVQHFSQFLLFLQYTSVSLTIYKEKDDFYFFLYAKSLKHHKRLVKCMLNEKVLKTCT